MVQIDKAYLEQEISRVTTILEEKWEEYLEFYTQRNVLVKSYVYGPSVSIHRGYYNPSIAVQYAIGGSKKGPKPKQLINSSMDQDIMVYGLDELLRPIYIQTWFSPNQAYSSFEIVQYIQNKIIGIIFYEFEPIGIHETQYENNKVKSIIECYYKRGIKPSKESCSDINIEVFDYNRSNHFQWKWILYHPNPSEYSNLINKISCSFSGDEYQDIHEMLYEFDTDGKDKVIRMYFDGQVKELLKNNSRQK